MLFFLVSLNILDSRIKRVIVAAPSLFSYSVENSLKPKVRQLVEEDGNVKNDFGMWTIKSVELFSGGVAWV